MLLVLLVVGLLTACQKSSEPKEEKKENADGGKGTLKVIAAYDAKEKVFEEFTKKTGIKVEFLDISSGEVLSKLSAQNGKIGADVWFGGGADSFIVAGEKGYLENYVSPEEKEMDQRFIGNDFWTGVSIVTAGFLVNTDVLAKKNLPEPKSWADLKNPKYKDELIMADPAISGTNYAVVYNLLQSMGEEAGWAYLESIKGNIPFYAQRGSEPTAKVKNAEMAVGIIPLGGDTYKMEKEFKVKNVIPSDGLPWVPAGMAIFKEAENKDAAKAFVDWALSKEGQEFLKTVAPRMMVRKDVTPPEELKGMTVDKLMKILTGPTARIISILALALLGFAIMAGLTENLSKRAIGWIAGSTIVFAAATWGPKFLGYSGALLM